MTLALSILFLWLGAALLFVCFHGLKDVENSSGGPADIFAELRGAAQKNPNAYSTSS